MNSYGQIPQRSIQNAGTCIQPQSLQEVVLKHKSSGRVVTWGEGRQTQTELMLLALNEDRSVTQTSIPALGNSAPATAYIPLVMGNSLPQKEDILVVKEPRPSVYPF